MAFRMKRSDQETLACIAEHRVLTIKQIVAIRQGSAQGIRRRLAALEKEQLIKAIAPRYGRGRGRPEKLISLTEEGLKVLRANGFLGCEVPTHRVTADMIQCVDHQLLVNWFRIQLSLVEKIVPMLSVRFLSPTSPFLQYGPDDRPLVADRAPAHESKEEMIGFIPDGVFAIADRERDKAVLFFLEVDMGTETLASPHRNRQDLRSKILIYQGYFRSQLYKRYGRFWDCSFQGFRLLFVTHTAERLDAVCRLVRDMLPSDFVWLTDQSQLFSGGAWGGIWSPGGRLDASSDSILGSRKPDPAPAPPTVL